MKKKFILPILFSVFLISQLCTQATIDTSNNQIGLDSSLILSSDLITIPDYVLDPILENKQPVFRTEQTIDKYLVIDLFFEDKSNVSTVIFDMEGNIIGAIPTYIRAARMVDARTLVLCNKTHTSLWNLETNELEHFEGYGYHHDYEYNPVTETFLGLGRVLSGTVDIGGSLYPIEYDTIYECLKNGTIIWEWSAVDHIPFNYTEFSILNAINKGKADWTHANGIHWDMTDDYIYFCSYYLSTVFKIDKTTGEVIWQIGAYESDFTMYNKYGEQKPSLFYGLHDIQYIGDNHFTIFDNDYSNRTDALSMTSRLVEFEIDEDNMIATEVFSYEGPSPSHYSVNRGGYDKLPFNTNLGSFCGNGIDETMRFFTEVNSTGNVIWELAINGSTSFKGEVFYSQPLVGIDPESLISIRKENGLVNFTVWNSYKNRIAEDGTLTVFDGDILLTEEDFEFLPEWEPTELSIELPLADYRKGIYNFTVIVENNDGFQSVGYILYNIVSSVEGWVIGVSVSGGVLALGAIGGTAFYIWKKKK